MKTEVRRIFSSNFGLFYNYGFIKRKFNKITLLHLSSRRDKIGYEAKLLGILF
jgi:hypothetical protein